MRRAVQILVLFLITHLSFAEQSIEIQDARVRATQSKVSAIYMTIVNKTNKDIVLTDVKYNGAKLVELHKTVIENGIAQMVHINKLLIPAKGSVILKPKGLHIMIMGLKQPLIAGDSIDIDMYFENFRKPMNTEIKIEK